MKQLLLTTTILAFAGVTNAQEQAPMVLQYDKPATFFEESLPIGNGKMGALIYGGSDDNVIYLNDITLWTGKPVLTEGQAPCEVMQSVVICGLKQNQSVFMK